MRPHIDDPLPPVGGDVETITILRSRARRLAKLVCADGTIEHYDHTRTFDLTEIQIVDFNALERLLCRLERRRDCCVVRGAIADPARTKRCRRLLHPDRETHDAPTLREVPRRWLAIDFDHLTRPEWIDPTDLLGCACVAIQTLPAEFQKARFIVQATGSHGLKPGIHIRLWCWLSRPTIGGELKYWLRKAPVDPSVFGAAHIIYTAAPQIQPGAFDPLTERVAVVPGEEEVITPRPDRLKPPKPLVRYRQEARGGDNNLDRLIHFVETAPVGNRNAALYWAARRAAEQNSGDARTAALLEEAAVRAGLSATEAAATICSGARHE
jgi:hypothetical protein